MTRSDYRALGFAAILLLAIAIAATAAWQAPRYILTNLNIYPIRVLLFCLVAVVLIDASFALYLHYVTPSSKRLVVRYIYFVFATGGTLSLAPYGLASLESIDFAVIAKAADKPGNAGFEAQGKAKFGNADASNNSVKVFATTAWYSFLALVLYATIDGAQALATRFRNPYSG